MNRRDMLKCAAALGGAVVLGADGQAAPRGGVRGPLPGWSCEFRLHKSEAISFVINGELWCRHLGKDLAYTWVLPDGPLVLPLPDKYRYVEGLTVVGVSTPWGKESLVHFCWNGTSRQKMEFGKVEEKSFRH